ncbi:MAG: ribonuclease PH [Desulfarculaceae bacterium]|nr:ribonuclease PH [Desulfarculaceae bacterium]MCF8073743.1 ribonuclease PH [Desulfarculaceae bacterium]MCF8101984.1 ribonuclease PH [Desulfarculaceae bacterium]MCF8115954.1 ribonuclease PH [Desulfarculaceae bacterium]
MRSDGRQPMQMRPIRFTPGVNPYAEGSCLAELGATKVHCTASVEKGVKGWLEGSGRGWVTAEYAMLPRATHTRTGRDHRTGGRAQEISRLIGRSLRAAVELESLEGYTVKVDCDVLVADGGTRCASICGGWVALAAALKGLGVAPALQVGAISLGRVEGELRVDLCYQEDSSAELDLNLVLTPEGLVEVQGTGENGVFSPAELAALVQAGEAAGQEIFAAQRAALDEA